MYTIGPSIATLPVMMEFLISAAKGSAIWGQSLLADHFEMALCKKSAKGLPRAIEVCQKII